LRRFSIFCSYSFAEYCPIWEVSECTYDYSGLEPFLIRVCSSLYAQEPIEVDRVSEPIAQPAENSPGAEVDSVSLGDRSSSPGADRSSSPGATQNSSLGADRSSSPGAN
jgi:hypothetical protein